MIGVKVGVTRKGPGLGMLTRGFSAIKGSEVLVGIPAASASRKGGKINNAELLFLFTNGSPLRGQPPRVVIQAAILAEPTKTRIAKELAAAAVAALHGDKDGMIEHLDRAGTIGESASKRWFTDSANGWEPNAISTQNQKLGKLSHAKREEAIDAILAAMGDTTGIITPGIMTGQMRRAITHVLDIHGDVGAVNGADLAEGVDIKWSSGKKESNMGASALDGIEAGLEDLAEGGAEAAALL
jgi:hypothetical protein